VRQRSIASWMAVVRLIAVPFAVAQVALTKNYPPGYAAAAWTTLAIFVAGAVVLYAVAARKGGRVVRSAGLVLDFAVISAFTLIFVFESGTSVRQLLFLAIVTGAASFGLTGGIAVSVAALPITWWFEERRSKFFPVTHELELVAIQGVTGLLIALLVGWLYSRLTERLKESETLRDELGRRADLLDAANRCARALSSSLDLDEAFGAFIRELRGLVPFERMAVVLAEDGVARVISTAGSRAEEVMPPGTQLSLERNVLADVIASAQTIYRSDMLGSTDYAEEPGLIAVGLRSRVVAPLLLGPRAIGLISIGRAEPDGFEPHEIELAGLLGRLAASAVQNIRAFESERRTVDELRSLSALRADFVSLVSHELRSPMAAVIGAARTLQQRWRELQPEQREAFLALIGDETTRLAALIGDVLDTSRIDAGTFSYRFTDVDLSELVTDTVATASLGQDEVPIVRHVPSSVPLVRGDSERLRQVLGNLIDNAVKYSPAGEPVEVRLTPSDGVVRIAVSDRGPGIKSDDQRVIFEKFGRVSGTGSKPGTGLGLFIARSITEAHGGTLAVSSAPGRGATFTVTLPL
jgi:signal transduction histidine kinase